jgi:hypothetical protein
MLYSKCSTAATSSGLSSLSVAYYPYITSVGEVSLPNKDGYICVSVVKHTVTQAISGLLKLERVCIRHLALLLTESCS